ncbi:DUF4412 domain-containing protein [Aureivirga sp. CE67]|uniref:DUF4412 domain-containing protein n=1 Tax=Aureivirga sp. CE67 TaxID=1788983 RepID=UPI0018C95616|nr:DUF4412 domain-containing protein [Aureivirga sp. CE67]
MKKIIVFFLFAMSLMSVEKMEAQKDFEGVLVYKYEYLHLPDEMMDYKDQLPKFSTAYRKGDMFKIEQEMMGGMQTFIADDNKQELSMLLDMNGQKMGMKFDLKEEKMDVDKVNLKHTNETKMIKGYKAKKVTFDQGENQVELWYTEELPNKFNVFLVPVDGMPLEYTTNVGGMQMKVTLDSIKEKKLDDSVFAVSDDYTMMDPKAMGVESPFQK